MVGGAGLSWPVLLGLWAMLGLGYSAVLTPGGRLLRRSAAPEDRSAVFAAQFALSHAGWLITYSVAGAVGAALGMGWTFAILGVIAAGGVAAALALWPVADPEALPHSHPDMPPSHPHLARHDGATSHQHAYLIDNLHQRWPDKIR